MKNETVFGIRDIITLRGLGFTKTSTVDEWGTNVGNSFFYIFKRSGVYNLSKNRETLFYSALLKDVFWEFKSMYVEETTIKLAKDLNEQNNDRDGDANTYYAIRDLIDKLNPAQTVAVVNAIKNNLTKIHQ